MAGRTGDACVLHGRDQIVEQLARLLGRPGVGALVVRNLELVAAFENLADQLVVGFKCFGHLFVPSYRFLGTALGYQAPSRLGVLNYRTAPANR